MNPHVRRIANDRVKSRRGLVRPIVAEKDFGILEFPVEIRFAEFFHPVVRRRILQAIRAFLRFDQDFLCCRQILFLTERPVEKDVGPQVSDFFVRREPGQNFVFPTLFLRLYSRHVAAGFALDLVNLANCFSNDAFEVRAESKTDLPFVAFAFLLRQATKLIETRADERVAAAQVVIEKVERLVGGNRGEPEGKFGQLHGQRIQVHAVDAGFNDTPPPICNLGFFLRLAFHELRLKLRGRVIDDVVGQERRGFDEEMA